MPITALITRPQSDGAELADKLRNLWGGEVGLILSPILSIEPLDVQPDLTGIECLIFTSRNGVAAFSGQTTQRDLPCFVVGQATADSARTNGFNVVEVCPDADRLVARLTAQNRSAPSLHVRGEHVTGDLARRLTNAGLPTREIVTYRQTEMPLSDAAIAALAGKTPVLLPLYSPRSARLLFSQGKPKAPLFIAVISENVAQTVKKETYETLCVAQQPHGDAMLELLDKLYQSAKSLEGTYRAK